MSTDAAAVPSMMTRMLNKTVIRYERLIRPFVQRAEQSMPNEIEAEQILREGLSFLSEFGGAADEDVPAMFRAAQRFLNQNYPVEVANAC